MLLCQIRGHTSDLDLHLETGKHPEINNKRTDRQTIKHKHKQTSKQALFLALALADNSVRGRKMHLILN